MFNLAALEAALAETIFAGKLHFSMVTGSTNTDALAAARANAPNGSVFFANEQQAGRGRGDHSWESAAGEGLYVSVLLRPMIGAAILPFLPLAAGLACAEAIRSETGIEIDLRWPNDLLIGERKAGGILVESKTEGTEVSFVVVGIGINVHQRSFDPGLSTQGTSLDMEAGPHISRQSPLVALLKSLEHEMALLSDRAAVDGILGRVERVSRGCVVGGLKYTALRLALESPQVSM